MSTTNGFPGRTGRQIESAFGSSGGLGESGRAVAVNRYTLGGRGITDFEFRKRGTLFHEGFDSLRSFHLANRFDLTEEKERHTSQMPGVTYW